MSKLTAKQEAFCREYLIDLNATQAAIRAGYSTKTARNVACENLTKPYISEYVQELMNERSKKTEITAEYVLASIKSVADRCMQVEEVLVNGEASGGFKFDSSGANKSLELLGRHLKLFVDKVEVDSTVQVTEIQRKIV